SWAARVGEGQSLILKISILRPKSCEKRGAFRSWFSCS
ncbi:hypothetical protein CFP56_043656, partial [Quercus suber]